MNNILPVSNIINVTIANTPSGLAERNINSVALFTTEQPLVPEVYGIYIAPAQVTEQYGTDSVTSAMANAAFAQNLNLRTGNGRLVIIPLINSVSATSGKTTTASLTANIAAIIAVGAGDLKVTIDGVAHNLTGLNFTAVTTLAGIASVLQAALVNAIVTVVGATIVITSKKVGTTSTVVIAVVSGGGGTDLAGASYFNAAGSTPAAGVSATGETIVAAIARTEVAVSYTPIMTNLAMQDTVVESLSDAIEAQDRMAMLNFASTEDNAGIITTIQQSGNRKTRCLLYTDTLADSNLMKAAYTGRAFSTNFSGSNTAGTMNLKQLATITPDANMTQTLYTSAGLSGADLYVSYDGVPSVFSSGGNDYFDNVYMDLALKFALETAGFNYLRQTNTKVPQTEAGMNGLKNAYAQVLERFIRNGSIAPGAWTSSDTFGDPEIFRQNILDRGYYIYSLPITQQAADEREQRKAPLIQIAIKRAGAIHTSDVIVEVND